MPNCVTTSSPVLASPPVILLNTRLAYKPWRRILTSCHLETQQARLMNCTEEYETQMLFYGRVHSR